MILALLLLLAAPARNSIALDPPSIDGRAADASESDLVRRMKQRLREEPDTAELVARRILASSLGPQFTKSAEPAKALDDLKRWVDDNAEAAAHLAIGFAKDDASGKKIFENSLYKDMKRFLELNPDNTHGVYGRLKRASKFAGSMKQMKELDNEDRQAIVNALFEGIDSQRSGKLSRTDNAGRWTRQKGIGPGESPGPGGVVEAGAGFYDRLKAGNPTGYSPDVLALQSELNRRKAPGAPNLVETGKLDYPTLRHPYHGLRYDVDRLSAAYRLHRAWTLSRAAGENYSREQLSDPALQAELERRAADRPENPAFARRRAALEKADAALAAFDHEAGKTRRPSGITRARIGKLSSLRQNAARWIAVASLEETLQNLTTHRGFMTQPLRRAVAQVPVSPEERARFLAAGDALAEKLETVLRQGNRAVSLLSADASGWPEAERLAGAVRLAAKRLPPAIQEYRDAPLKAAEGTRPATGWRAKLDALLLEYLPRLGYSKRLRQKQADARKRLDAFRRIAQQAP